MFQRANRAAMDEATPTFNKSVKSISRSDVPVSIDLVGLSLGDAFTLVKWREIVKKSGWGTP